MGWIGKLLGSGTGSREAQEAARPEPGVGAQDAPDAAEVPASAAEVDFAWYRWLAAGGSLPAPPGVEAAVLERLAALAAAPAKGAALVPRVPEIIPQLLRLLRDEDMNVTALSRHLSQDVVLVAEVYREANRPCYRPRYHAGPPVSSIDGAIMLLGQNGMRMLLARVALRPVMSMASGRLARQAAPLVWRQSEKCAQAASVLAPAMRAHAFEAYLAGLMENVGLVVALRLVDELAQEGTVPQSPDFVARLFADSRRLSARIAALWEFPEPVSAAIEGAAALDAFDAADAPPLARALALADRIGKLRMLVDGARFAADDPFVTAGLSRAALGCFAQLQDEEE